jgi:hypothetical protein
VSQSDVSPAGLSDRAPARVEEQPGPKAAPGASGWTGGRIASLAIGSLLVLVSLGLLGGGGIALWAYLTQREAGYVTSGVHTFSTAGSALATEETQLGSAGVGWAYSPSVLGTVRIRVRPASSGPPLFVGIGRSSDVDRYLAGVEHTVISDFWGDKVEPVSGGRPDSAPGTQPFWVASSTGPGARTLHWKPADGSWTVVVMNADGRPGVDIRADLGARMPALPWIALGLLVGGAVFMAGGVLLIVGAVRRRAA